MFSILLYTFAGLFLLSLGVRRMWLNVVFFSLEATLAYTIVGNLVPQIESRPQAELVLSADATPEQLAALGRRVAWQGQSGLAGESGNVEYFLHLVPGAPDVAAAG